MPHGHFLLLLGKMAGEEWINAELLMNFISWFGLTFSGLKIHGNKPYLNHILTVLGILDKHSAGLGPVWLPQKIRGRAERLRIGSGRLVPGPYCC